MSKKKKLEIESIMKDKEMIIHHEYTDNFNIYFSSILKVLLQTSMPYKDPFDHILEVSYAFKGIRGVLIHSKKNIRHKCFKFRRKPKEYNSYKFEKINSRFQVWNQVQVALTLHSHEKVSTKKFVLDPRGNSD